MIDESVAAAGHRRVYIAHDLLGVSLPVHAPKRDKFVDMIDDDE